MVIEIDDSLSGYEMRKQLVIQMVRHAHTKKELRREIANFLGYSRRWLTDTLNTYDELADLRDRSAKFEEEWGRQYEEMMRRYPDK